jgi:hypothetical protein
MTVVTEAIHTRPPAVYVYACSKKAIVHCHISIINNTSTTHELDKWQNMRTMRTVQAQWDCAAKIVILATDDSDDSHG